jgi:hypothetical protein
MWSLGAALHLAQQVLQPARLHILTRMQLELCVRDAQSARCKATRGGTRPMGQPELVRPTAAPEARLSLMGSTTGRIQAAD